MSINETSDFQSEKTGSTPVGSANEIKHLAQSDETSPDALHVELHVEANQSDDELKSISARLKSLEKSLAQYTNTTTQRSAAKRGPRKVQSVYVHPALHLHPGPVINARLGEVNMTARDLARKADVSATILYKMINGQIAVSPRCAVLISDILGMDPLEILVMQAQFNVEVERLRIQGALPQDARTRKIKPRNRSAG